MNKEDPIFLAGHNGLVGAAIARKLRAEGYENLLLRDRRSLDLRRQADVEAFFAETRPAYVFLAAGKVGGIHANSTYPADFIRDNLQIQVNIIDSALRYRVKKFLFLGSSCIYPKQAPQPMREDHLLTGPLEPTNEWYAVAKIAGLKMCQAYRRQHGFRAICAMPTNLYGPYDNFSLENSHVVPALIRKFHDAAAGGHGEVTVWGTGTPRREFLHVDDLADALLFLMRNSDGDDLINVGAGYDISIGELAQLVARIVGFRGRIAQDHSKPDGAPRKLLDVSRMTTLGWTAGISLEEGLRSTYAWYQRNLAKLRQ